MDFLKQYKNIFIGAGVLALVFGGYWFWKNRGASEEGPALVMDGGGYDSLAQNPEAASAGQQIISILNDLRNLEISGEVFESPVFRSLVDHSIATTTESLGRPDPFAPLPFELQQEKKANQ